jgi:hypothetical protein
LWEYRPAEGEEISLYRTGGSILTHTAVVANITVGRCADSKPHVQVTYRFGPPQLAEAGPEGMHAPGIPNDKAFEIRMSGGDSHTFDSFECAIHALAPTCEYCNVKVIGHSVGGRPLLLLCPLREHGRSRRGRGPGLS